MLKYFQIAILLASLLPGAAWTAGSGSSFGGSGDRNAHSSDIGEEARRRSSDSNKRKKRRKDDVYDQGQALLARKVRAHRNLSVCIDVDGELITLTRTTSAGLQRFKRRSALAKAMHDCGRSGSPALSTVMSDEDVDALAYFLDRRLALDLAPDKEK